MKEEKKSRASSFFKTIAVAMVLGKAAAGVWAAHKHLVAPKPAEVVAANGEPGRIRIVNCTFVDSPTMPRPKHK